MATMRLLVTGGAGYIGSATARRLLDRGHDVTVLDNLSNGHAEDVPDGATLVVGDIDDPEIVRGIAGRGDLDGCLHFAASIEVAESMRRPESFFGNNTAATLRLLETLVDLGCPRFLLSSTAATYGNPQSTPIEEDHPKAPTSAYGESKLLIERALGWLADLDRIRYAALRYFNAAGAVAGHPERHDPEVHLIPLAVDAVTGARGPLTVYGTDYDTPDGTCVRDFVHIDDLATAHVAAMERLDDGIPRALNLGSGSGFSVREVLAAVESVIGKPVPHSEGPRRPGDPGVLVASNARAREALGWAPSYTLEQMVAATYESRVTAPASPA